VKEHGVIMSTPMVQALLEGRKTQTRRLATSPLRSCQIGDRLWIREHVFVPPREISERDWRDGADTWPAAIYAADDMEAGRDMVERCGWRSRPSIHMPRTLARLVFDVVDVRFQSLHDISYDDVLAEGCPVDPDYRDTTQDQSNPHMVSIGVAQWQSPRLWYHRLWASLHSEESWQSNPDVVALTFKVVR
jgi:hypothetical protein